MCRIHLYVRNSLDFPSQVLYGIYARGASSAVDIQYCSFVAHSLNVRIDLPQRQLWQQVFTLHGYFKRYSLGNVAPGKP